MLYLIQAYPEELNVSDLLVWVEFHDENVVDLMSYEHLDAQS